MPHLVSIPYCIYFLVCSCWVVFCSMRRESKSFFTSMPPIANHKNVLSTTRDSDYLLFSVDTISDLLLISPPQHQLEKRALPTSLLCRATRSVKILEAHLSSDWPCELPEVLRASRGRSRRRVPRRRDAAPPQGASAPRCTTAAAPHLQEERRRRTRT